MKSELILTSSEVEDLAVCVDCAFLECFDCPRNKAKQKLKEAARKEKENEERQRKADLLSIAKSIRKIDKRK